MLREDWFVIDRDRAAFLGVFLIGLVTILLGSGRTDSGGLPWTVLILLIVFMVAYAWFAHYWNVRHWGDMCYYMGFLFTLVSMMAALRQYTAGTSLDEIIPTFALALGTTVAGLVLRVVGDEQPTDERGEELPFLEPAIRDGAERVGKALHGLATAVEQVQGDLRGGGPDLLASLRDGLVEPVASQAERLARSLDKMSDRTGRAGTVFGNVSGDIKTRWKETLDQLETPTTRLATLGQEVEDLTADLRELAGAQADVLTSLESVRETSAEVLDQSRSVLAIQGQTLDELRSVVASVLGATTKAHDGLVTTSDQIGARTSELHRTLGSWQSAIDAMARAGETQTTLVGDIHNSVAELSRTVAGIQPAVRSLADSAAGMHDAATQFGAANHHMERLSDEMVRFPQLVNEAHNEGAALLGKEMNRSLDKVTTSLRQAISDALDQASSALDGQSRKGSLLPWPFRKRGK